MYTVFFLNKWSTSNKLSNNIVIAFYENICIQDQVLHVVGATILRVS